MSDVSVSVFAILPEASKSLDEKLREVSRLREEILKEAIPTKDSLPEATRGFVDDLQNCISSYESYEDDVCDDDAHYGDPSLVEIDLVDAEIEEQDYEMCNVYDFPVSAIPPGVEKIRVVLNFDG